MDENKKMIIAVSGGVDSSAAAELMQKAGYDLTGIFMRLSDNYEESERSARGVCNRLGIGFYPVDLSDRFKSEVIDYFLDSYASGQTPNPCVKCNFKIKFGELLRIADELGAYWLSTGHYADIRLDRSGKYGLYKASDKNKDQSYFLYNLNQRILKRVKFPLAGLSKDDARKIAKKSGLPAMEKESQDICFLNREGRIMDHNEYLKSHLEPEPGDIRLQNGKKIGEHKGLPYYTIGQRKGLEIGGTGPYYAIRMDYEGNILYVTGDPDDPALFRSEFEVANTNWINPESASLPLACDTAVRYRHPAVSCVINEKNGRLHVRLDSAQRAVTSGQSAVFYDKDKVLGGGIIA